MKITIESDDGSFKVTAEGDEAFILRVIAACKPEVKVPDPAPYFPYTPQPWITWSHSLAPQKCQWCGRYDCHESHIICNAPCVSSVGSTLTVENDGTTSWTVVEPVTSSGPVSVYHGKGGVNSGGVIGVSHGGTVDLEGCGNMES